MRHWQVKLSLILNYFVFAVVLNSVGTVILQVQNNYGVSQSSASTLEAFKDLSIAFASFFGGTYLTRIGYKNAMMIALGLTGGACLLMPSFPSFIATKALFVVTGLSFALVRVSNMAAVGLVTEGKREHASFMNFLDAFVMIEVLAGYFIFSAFVDSTDPHSTAWLRVYYLIGGISFGAMLFLAFTRLDESRIAQVATLSMMGGIAQTFRLAASPLVLLGAGSVFLYVLIEQGIMSWLPTYNSQILHLPTALSIEMASILSASAALGRLGAGFILRRFHWFRPMAIFLLLAAGLVLVAIPLAAQGTGREITGWATAPLAAFIFPLIGLFIAPVFPLINSLVLSSAPVHEHGAISGVMFLFAALGGSTGSIITGHMFQALGGQTAFYCSLVPLLLLLGCLFLFHRASGPAARGGGPQTD